MTPVAEPSASQYAQLFSEVEKSLAGQGLPWLSEIRRDALHRFNELGFPTTKDERWRYTPVGALGTTFFQVQTAPTSVREDALGRFKFNFAQPVQLVFINGRFSPTLSAIPDGLPVQAGNMAAFLASHPRDLENHLGRYADANEHAFTALNTALFTDGAHIYVPKNVVCETPIHILYVMTPAGAPVQSHVRSLFVLGENSQASIIESFAGLKNDLYFQNAVTEIVLSDNSRLNHYKLEQESTAAFHVSTTQVHQERSSAFRSREILLGGAVARNNVNVSLAGEGAECDLRGLFTVTSRQVSDTHTWIDHAAPHGTSRQYFKGILQEKSQGVFDGHIVVRPAAQKTDSSQTNKNLLLSSEARVHTKPELKIFANDVKCKHGATIGQINNDQLFYLRSRGLSKENARKLLIIAFATEIIESIEIEAVREAMKALLFSTFRD